jgi:cytochrome c556
LFSYRKEISQMLLRKSLVALLPLGLASCAQPRVAPHATVKQHMQEITIPASNSVFAVAGKEPQADNEWKHVKANALALVDSGEWLMTYPSQVDQQPWLEAARNMVDAAKKAAQAAEAKQAENAAEAGNSLYEACESCHAAYLHKPVSHSD